MNDRYLYKAKRLDNGEWVKGDLVHSVYKINDICVGKYGSEIGMHQVDESTICQCTGLKDKNDELIWENDIVKGFYVDGSERFLCKIIWEECLGLGWCNKPVKSLSIYEWQLHKAGLDAKLSAGCEVVGNIFDNPELLEVEE